MRANGTETRSLGRAIKAVVGASVFIGALLGALAGLVAALSADGAADIARRAGTLWFGLLLAVPAVVALTLRSDLASRADDEAPPLAWRTATGFGAGVLAALAFVGMATTLAVIVDGGTARQVSASVRGEAGGVRVLIVAVAAAVAGLVTARMRIRPST